MIDGIIYMFSFLLLFIVGLGMAEVCLRFCDRLLKRKWRVRRDRRILNQIGQPTVN